MWNYKSIFIKNVLLNPTKLAHANLEVWHDQTIFTTQGPSKCSKFQIVELPKP